MDVEDLCLSVRRSAVRSPWPTVDALTVEHAWVNARTPMKRQKSVCRSPGVPIGAWGALIARI
jgi:hypothetical protein